MNIINNSLGEENGMIFRESKELLLNISLDDFADDCFNIRKLLTEEEISFILLKAGESELSMNAMKKCLDTCISINQDQIIPSLYHFLWKGKVKGGCFKVQFISIFLTLDNYLSFYEIENNCLREHLGSYEM